jgi:hypothetical protein
MILLVQLAALAEQEARMVGNQDKNEVLALP